MHSLIPTLMAIVLAAPATSKFDTANIEQLTGAKGALNEKEGVFKVSLPRSDLHVVAGGVHLTPPMGLTAWAAFTKVGSHTAVMGDMVLTEDQVNPAMSAALDNGLEVTALHNHFFWDQPRVMFMHVGGMGEEARLAAAVGKVFAQMKQNTAQPHRNELLPTVSGRRSSQAHSEPTSRVGSPVRRPPWSIPSVSTAEVTVASARPTAATLSTLRVLRVRNGAGITPRA